MNTSLRDLQQKVDAVETPHLDVADLVVEGERRLRRRRVAITAGGVAAVLAVAVAGAQLTDLSGQSLEPVRPGPTTPSPSPTETLVIPNGQVTVIPEIGETDLSGWTPSAEQTNNGANPFSTTVDVKNPDHATLAWYCSGAPDLQIFVAYGGPDNQVKDLQPCDGDTSGHGSPEGWLSPSGYYYSGEAEQWEVDMMLIDGMPEAQWNCFQSGTRTDCETAYPPLEPVDSDDTEFGFTLWEHEAPYIAGLFDDGKPGAWRHLPLDHVFEALSMYDGVEYVFDRIVYAAPNASTLAVHLDDLDQPRLVGAFQISTPAEDLCAARLGLGDTNEERFGNGEQISAACEPTLQLSVDGQTTAPSGALRHMSQWGEARALVPPGAHDVTVAVTKNDPRNARYALIVWRVRE